jgi:hypothetical protein
MTTDRELLELAAKAAGIEVFFDDDGDCYRVKASENRAYWNPLQFDGDALRLAVNLQLHVLVGVAQTPDGDIHVDKNMGDPYAATRRAIVCAAVEIGKAMP